MLVIRLRRQGKKHQPTYRIVVADQRKSVSSPYIEMLGHYNPKTKEVVLNKEPVLEWLKKGAKPTNTVAKILTKQGLKHNSIVIQKFRAVSKKELEAQKAQEEVEKEKEQAEKEAAKAAFEEKVEAEKATQPSSEEKLQAVADEVIAEEKAEEVKEEVAEKIEKKETSEAQSPEASAKSDDEPAK